MIAEAGFSYCSISLATLPQTWQSTEGITRLKSLLTDYGLSVDTIHGPGIDQPESVAAITLAAEMATFVGAPIIVLHGGPFDFPAEEFPKRLTHLISVCDKLDQIADTSGVLFALENVCPGPATQLVQVALKQLNIRHFGLCYDSSHDQIDGPHPFDLLRELAGRISAVHLSDRSGPFVDHQLPGKGFIDWSGLMGELRESSFSGSLLLEVMMRHSSIADPLSFLRLAYHQGRKLAAGKLVKASEDSNSNHR